MRAYLINAPPPTAELSRVDVKFYTIKNLEPYLPSLNFPLWMSLKSILLIDKRASLYRNPCHIRSVARVLTKSIRRSLIVESHRQAEEAVTAIWACLEPSAGETNLRGAYAILKRS